MGVSIVEKEKILSKLKWYKNWVDRLIFISYAWTNFEKHRNKTCPYVDWSSVDIIEVRLE